MSLGRTPTDRTLRELDDRTVHAGLFAPAAPVALAADTIGATQFRARWQAVSGAMCYLLTVTTDAAGTVPVSDAYQRIIVTDLERIVTGLTAGASYYYYVEAHGGRISSRSNIIATGPLVGVGVVTRTTDGLLLRYEYDNGDYPFLVGDWATSPNLSRSIVGGKLRLQATVGGSIYLARASNSPVRSTRFTQAVVQGVLVSVSNLQVGPAAHVEADVAIDSHVSMRYTVQRTPNDIVALQEHTNAATTASTTSAITARGLTEFRLGVVVATGAFRGYDHTAATELTLAGTGIVSGQSGIAVNSGGGANGVIDVLRFFDCRDRFVTVAGAGLVNGYIVKVRKADGTIVAQGVVAGGTASIDLSQKVLAADFENIAIYSAADVLLRSFAPGGSGVWPGDIYNVAAA